jgi:hypothetical protein
MHEVAATRQLRPPSPNYESRSIGNNLGDLEQEIASARYSNPLPANSGDAITANVRRNVLGGGTGNCVRTYLAFFGTME